MAYQRGSLKKVPRKEGDTWVLRYRVTNADGERVENTLPVGFVRDFPKAKDAWREVDRLGLLVRINDTRCPVRIRFASLAEHYLKHDMGAGAVRPKTERTVLNTAQIIRAYLVPRWGNLIADDLKPLELQRWLQSLHTDKGLAWTTVSKFRGTMLRIYKIGLLHELVNKNPVLPVETRSTTNYKAILVTPQQTLTILQSLPNPLHRILVLPVRRPPYALQSCLHCAGATSCGTKARLLSPNAGLSERTVLPRPESPKAMFHSTLFLPAI